MLQLSVKFFAFLIKSTKALPTSIISPVKQKLKAYICNRRAAAIIRELAPHICTQNRIIDIGAGGCKVSQAIMTHFYAPVTPVDVVDHNSTAMPLVVYDGRTLPYPSNSFEIALIIFVLHHASDTRRLIDEAARVSKDKIIVIEDTPTNFIEQRAWRRIDDHLNNHKHSDIQTAHGTRSAGEWKAFFQKAGLRVVQHHAFKRFALSGACYTHTLFILEHDT